MRRKINLLLFLLLLSAHICISQTIKIEKKDETSKHLQKEAIAFLRDAAAEVGTLRTLENRIGFSSELASLMWIGDEKEARAMYQGIIGDFQQLLTQYDSQFNAAGDDQSDVVSASPFSGTGNGNARRMMKALGVRQQIAASLAEHDAQLALDFFAASGQAVTNPKFRKQIEERDSYFETQLISQIAEQDVDTALKYGRTSLAKNYGYEHANILKKIYEKDAEKGAAFGEDIVRKLKSADEKTNYHQFASLLDMGIKNAEKIKETPGKKLMFSEQSMREIADLMVKEILKSDKSELYGLTEYISQIEKISPAGALQLRQKFGASKQNRTKSVMKSGAGVVSDAAAPAPPKIESEQNPQQLTENMQSLSAKELSKDEREKTIARARKNIIALKDTTQKIMAFSALASQVSALGDKELAGQIMDEAKNLVNPQPKNYVEFMQTWMLIGSLAQVDARKAFPVIEDTIPRLNEMLGAFVKVGEFIDVEGDIINDGEVQVGAFGGAMTRDLLKTLGAADVTVRSLATADFDRTKDLTNKFDRVEARILAKMIVLRAVLGGKNTQILPEENFQP